MERVELGISDEYWHNWDEKKAICEIISNAFDNSDTKNDVSLEKSGRTLIIRNKKVLPSECLFLGKSYSRDKNEAIGMFGEGLKACALVLLRNDESMTVRTGDKLITPEFTNKTLDGKTVRTFVWIIEDGLEYIPETNVKLTTDISIDDLRKEYLYLSSETILEELIRTDKGVVFTQLGDSKLYVKGKLIKNLSEHGAVFSYNLFTDSINRDRDIVDMFDLRWDIGTILERVEDVKIIKRVLSAIIDSNGIESAAFRKFIDPNNLVEDCWKEMYGRKAVIATEGTAQTIARHKGYTTVSVANSGVISGLQKSGIKTDKDVATQSDYYNWIKSSRGERELIENTYNLFENCEDVRKCVKPIFKIFDNKGKENNNTLGVCIKADGLIGLNKKLFDDERELFSAIGHELTHFVYNTIDNTEEHDHYMGKMFTDVIFNSNVKE